MSSRTAYRLAGIALGVLAVTAVLPVQQASAQGLFEALFGGFNRRAPAPLPPSATSFADPFGLFGNERRSSSSGYGGGGMAYCVRTCDGRYFPLQRNASVSPAELCKSFCPASKTMVFSGGKIDYATASNGTRYADMDTAFTYREKIVDNCTCNGKDALGLARVNVADDPTLRPGDIVATNEGFASYRGNGRSKSADFTPINTAAMAGELGRRLAATKVTPASAPEKVTPVADDPKPVRGRSVQLSR